MLYLFASSTMMAFGLSLVQLYFAVYAVKVLLIDEAVWPFILAALPITMIILAIPIGKIVDKVNRKLPILLAYASLGIALWLFVNGDLLKLFISLVLFGAGQVMMNSAYSALQADLTPKDNRGKINGFSSFTNCILMALGSLAGGILYEHISHQLPFYLATVLIVPAFVLALVMVHEPEKREE